MYIASKYLHYIWRAKTHVEEVSKKRVDLIRQFNENSSEPKRINWFAESLWRSM